MLSANLSNVFVSKGYEDKPAMNFINGENGEISVVSFNLSASVYDSKAENNKRYVSIPCKAFGVVAQRIEKMKVDAGANVNIAGILDEDRWEKDGQKHRRLFVRVEAIEYNGAGRKKKEDGDSDPNAAPSGTTQAVESSGVFDDDDLPF